MIMAITTGTPCEAQLPTWNVEAAVDFSGATTQDVRVLDDSLVVLAPLPADRNLASDRRATDEFGRTVPLVDGTTETEWLSGTPNVVGRQFTVDLGLERLVSRVRRPEPVHHRYLRSGARMRVRAEVLRRRR